MSIARGEKRTVRICAPAAGLLALDVAKHAFAVEPGEWEIAAGASSRDLRGTARIVIA